MDARIQRTFSVHLGALAGCGSDTPDFRARLAAAEIWTLVVIGVFVLSAEGSAQQPRPGVELPSHLHIMLTKSRISLCMLQVSSPGQGYPHAYPPHYAHQVKNKTKYFQLWIFSKYGMVWFPLSKLLTRFIETFFWLGNHDEEVCDHMLRAELTRRSYFIKSKNSRPMFNTGELYKGVVQEGRLRKGWTKNVQNFFWLAFIFSPLH